VEQPAVFGALRRAMPATEEYVYFQTSGFSPKPEAVIEVAVRWTRAYNRGPALPGVYTGMLAELERARADAAALLHAHPDEIMLSENTTIGINVVAHGIDWRQGDNVILSDHEHPGNRIPWYGLTPRYGVEVRFLPVQHDATAMVAALDGLLDARTRVVSVSHVCRRTGQRLPAAELIACAHARGVPVLLDGAQAVGAVPVDVRELDCDFYTFSGHKYLLAPQGTGGLYVRRDRIDWLRPNWIGSHSQKDFTLEGGLTLLDEAKRFEFGTRNLPDQAAFGFALRMWAEIGWSQVFAYLEAYTDALKAALLELPGLTLDTPRPYAQSSAIVTFRLRDPHTGEFMPSAAICQRLADARILASTLEKDTTRVRVSTHVFNTSEDAERLLAGLVRLL